MTKYLIMVWMRKLNNRKKKDRKIERPRLYGMIKRRIDQDNMKQCHNCIMTSMGEKLCFRNDRHSLG
jgi:hypothetical protein